MNRAYQNETRIYKNPRENLQYQKKAPFARSDLQKSFGFRSPRSLSNDERAFDRYPRGVRKARRGRRTRKVYSKIMISPDSEDKIPSSWKNLIPCVSFGTSEVDLLHNSKVHYNKSPAECGRILNKVVV